MSIEVVLFFIIGSLAVASAVLMLLSENAVHSALFLIINFLCVASLYVLLDAAFLALVQVAVYAGAIMVLFLFVIMLLGAEEVGTAGTKKFRWIAPLALVLSALFLIVVGVALIQGDIDSRDTPIADPMVRVIHAASDMGTVDFYLNDVLVGDEVNFFNRGDESSAITEFTSVEPGDYVISYGSVDEKIALGEISLEAGQTVSVIMYGQGTDPVMGVVDENIDYIDDRKTRLVFFNGLSDVTVRLVDAGSDFDFTDATDAAEAPVIIESLAPGMSSESLLITEGEKRWALVDASSPDQFVARMKADDSDDGFEAKVRTGALMILAQERLDESSSLQTTLITVSTPMLFSFGSPQAVGESLFTTYVLPFEMVAILLLAAMIGVIILAQQSGAKPKPGRPTRRKVSRKLTSVIASQTGTSVDETYAQLSESVND